MANNLPPPMKVNSSFIFPKSFLCTRVHMTTFAQHMHWRPWNMILTTVSFPHTKFVVVMHFWNRISVKISRSLFKINTEDNMNWHKRQFDASVSRADGFKCTYEKFVNDVCMKMIQKLTLTLSSQKCTLQFEIKFPKRKFLLEFAFKVFSLFSEVCINLFR